MYLFIIQLYTSWLFLKLCQQYGTILFIVQRKSVHKVEVNSSIIYTFFSFLFVIGSAYNSFPQYTILTRRGRLSRSNSIDECSSPKMPYRFHTLRMFHDHHTWQQMTSSSGNISNLVLMQTNSNQCKRTKWRNS